MVDASPSERIERHIAELSVAEKAQQLVGVAVGPGGDLGDQFNTLGEISERVRDAPIGTVAAAGSGRFTDIGVETAVEASNQLQRAALEESAHGIPLCLASDSTHGVGFVRGASVAPHNLALACSFDPALAERVARMTATEARAVGITHNQSPTTDVVRDPRWGRTFETFGESPRLVGAFAAATVRGYQGEGLDEQPALVATPKHFPAYGSPQRGEDASPVEISDYTLRRVFLPPFRAAVEAGAEAVMPCYNSLDGEPVHGSRRYLTGLLREELGFDGYVVSDWTGIEMLETHHKTAGSYPEAVQQATDAGIDVGSLAGQDQVDALVDLVEAGDIDESRLDASLRRFLDAKERQGLFEDPFVDLERAESLVGADEHRDLVLEAARTSVVLLENDDTLPLEEPAEILVTGPNADDLSHQRGGWTTLGGATEPGTTVKEGLSAVTDATVVHEPGAGISDGSAADREAAVAAASDADAAVVVLGEPNYIHEFGPSQLMASSETGEFPSRETLALPDCQQRLLDAVGETGTPTICCLVTGRPNVFESTAADAVLGAFYPGMDGGRAIAEILVGRTAPSGALPLSWPRSTAQLPQRFNQLRHPHPIGDDEHPPSYDPEYAFGHGLTYTSFAYENLEPTADTVAPGEEIAVSVTVENVGERAGTDVVLGMLTDAVSSRVRPRRELAAFERVPLEAGDQRRVQLSIPQRALEVIRGRERVIEPGSFTVQIGPESTSFEVVESA